MLSKKNRITRSEFSPLFYQKGKIFHTDNLIVRVMKLKDNRIPRVAVTCSKKVSPLAVERNRLRRAVYMSVHKKIDSLPKDIFIFSFKQKKKETPTVSSKKIDKEVTEFFEKT